MIRLSSLLCAAALGSLSISATAGGEGIYGTWRNPKGTIDVRTAPCAGGLCGQIVRATPKAVEDAHKKGIDQLIGLQLLQNYHLKDDVWAGRVYVPDMGRTFSSRIAMVGHDQIKISGCLFGGMLCKSQVWTRI